MFVEALILSIIIGYIMKGSIKNIGDVSINKMYLVIISYTVEVAVFLCVRKGVLETGTITYCIYLLEYILIFLFIYFNRRNKFIVVMGAGFLLNALAIFLNGGTMPVSGTVISAAGMSSDVAKEGLYSLVEEGTRLAFLGDVIYFKIFKAYVLSIGDIVAALGLMFFIITSMKKDKMKGRVELCSMD